MPVLQVQVVPTTWSGTFALACLSLFAAFAAFLACSDTKTQLDAQERACMSASLREVGLGNVATRAMCLAFYVSAIRHRVECKGSPALRHNMFVNAAMPPPDKLSGFV